MTFEEKCSAWYEALPEERQAEVRAMVGLIPQWMVESLHAAGLPVVSVEMTNGHSERGYLMPTALMMFVSDLPRHD